MPANSTTTPSPIPPRGCGWRSCAPPAACARRRRRRHGLTPTSTAALATIERHGPLTPSELAEIERVKRPTVTRTLGCLEREGLIERTPDPADGRSALVSDQRRRPGAAAAPARPQERLPGAPHARAARGRGARRWSAPPRSSSGCWRASAGDALERRPAPILRLARGPQLPPLLRRPGDLALRQLDADGRGDLADPQPHRQRHRGRPHHRAAVPADAALRRLGRPARRPHRQAPAADHHPDADGDSRDRPLRRHRDRRRRALDGLPRGLR